MSRERTTHPVAWWLWALGLGAAASRTSNLLVLGLIISTCAVVVARRKSEQPWANAFVITLKIGVVIVAIRVVLQLFFGTQLPGQTIIKLPSIPLPDWAAGVRLGGSTSAPSLMVAVREGLQFATIFIAAGAANSLASPTRLLRALPGVLYETGVAVTVALSFGPQMIASAQRIRRARRLRGRPTRGIAGIRAMAIPVLESALEQAVALAAAMDSRGYGRRGETSKSRIRLTTCLLIVGVMTCAVGTYLSLDASQRHGIGVGALVLGAALLITATLLGRSMGHRTRYRPDPFGPRELGVAICGITPAIVLTVSSAGLTPPSIPLQWPSLPLVAALAIGVALLPAWISHQPAPAKVVVLA